jgi:hypothetical protein
MSANGIDGILRRLLVMPKCKIVKPGDVLRLGVAPVATGRSPFEAALTPSARESNAKMTSDF